MNRICKVILAAVAITALAAPAMAADKLIVKPATGTLNPLTVTDGGNSGFNVAPLYPVDVAVPDGSLSSTLHFAYNGADNGGWLTSAGENNFFLSSGAVYKGGWIQKASTGQSVFFGTGGSGFSAYCNSGATVGGPVTQNLVLRINYAGNMGLGVASATQRLEVNGGVRLNTLTAQPTCDATNGRGTIWAIQGAAGVKDSIQVCAKDAANTYAWRPIY